MGDKKLDFGLAAYVIGIVSIVSGVFQPLSGFILGIVGIVISNKESGELANRGKRLSIIGIIVSVISFILTMLLVYYLNSSGLLPQV